MGEISATPPKTYGILMGKLNREGKGQDHGQGMEYGGDRGVALESRLPQILATLL